jgi:hypothetical protein
MPRCFSEDDWDDPPRIYARARQLLRPHLPVDDAL